MVCHPLPRVLPHFLVDAAKIGYRFAIIWIADENGFDFDNCLIYFSQAIQMERFFTPKKLILAVYHQPLTILIKRKLVAAHVGKSPSSFGDGFLFDQWILDLFSQKQNVADSLLTLGDGNAFFPFVVFTPETSGERRA